MVNDDGAHSYVAPFPPETVRVTIDHAEPGCFAELLQSGFYLPVGEVCPVRVFLRDAMGLDDEYIHSRVQTVFLNGLAVDDLDVATVRPGSRLALSAALPGLVGASMRRGGCLASLRQGVTHLPDHEVPPSGPFLAEVRLFNLIGHDLAARMLAKGVFVRPGKLQEFLGSRRERFWDCLRSISPMPCGQGVTDRQGILQLVWSEPENLLLLNLAEAPFQGTGPGEAASARQGA